VEYFVFGILMKVNEVIINEPEILYCLVPKLNDSFYFPFTEENMISFPSFALILINGHYILRKVLEADSVELVKYVSHCLACLDKLTIFPSTSKAQ